MIHEKTLNSFMSKKYTHIVDKTIRGEMAKERGARLKEVIRRMRLKQREVAEELGMSLSGFTYLLSGRSLITPMIAYAFEFKYSIGSEWILHGSGFRHPEARFQLTPWDRMILELHYRDGPDEFLEKILTGKEWSERANEVLRYFDFVYLKGKITP